MSGISKLLELRKDSDTESQSSYETVPEEFTYDKDCVKHSDRDFDFVNEKNGDDSAFDSSPGTTFCASSDGYLNGSEMPLMEVRNVVEQVTEERPTFVHSFRKLKSVNSKEYLEYFEPDAELDFFGSEMLKQFDLATPDVIIDTTEFNNDNKSGGSMFITTDLDDYEQFNRKTRTERSSGSDDTLQFLESDSQLGFLQSELLQRLQLVRQDSSKSDSDDNEEMRPNYERSRSEQLERIIEEETENKDISKDVIREILQLQQSETLKSNIVEAKGHLEYPKVDTIKVCDAVLQVADESQKSLITSTDNESSLVINTGLSDDEEYHRIMAMSHDFTPDDPGPTLANLVPGSDIEESEDSLVFMPESYQSEVKSHPQHSKRQLHT